MTYPEMADAVRAYFKRNGNKAMTSAEVFDDQFKDQDKVRFQLVFSNMALKPPHEMVKLQTSGGSRGATWRLREPSDPPFVEPVKATRAKRVIEIDRPLASAATGHVSKVTHRSIGNVAETPPEVRAREVHESIPVEHRVLTPPPPNNALANAMARAAKTFTPPKASVPIAAFKDQKTLNYELAPDAKLVSVPRGASSLNPRIDGAVELPRHKVEAKVKADPTEPTPAYVDPDLDIKASTTQQPQATAGVAKTLPALKLVDMLQPITVPNGTPEPVHQAPQTPGQLLDLFIATAGPMFKSMITEAVKEALHAHSQVSPSHPAQAPAVEAGPRSGAQADVQATGPAPISVPAFEEPAPPPKHKPLMPGEIAAQQKTRLPKVVVIGLPKPQWEHDVKERFAKWLDIRTVHADSKPKTARELSKQVEHVLCMIDYIGHSIEASLKTSPAIPYERVNGGPGKLDEKLREIIKSYQQPEAKHA